MKKLSLIIVLTSLGAISYQATGSSYMPTVKVDFPETIKVQPDLSKLGEQMGTAAKESIKGGITGAVEGFSEAAQSESFGQHMGKGFRGISEQTAEAFTEAAGSEELRRQMKRGGKVSAKTMGIGAKSFTRGLQTEVFPQLEKAFRDFGTSFINVENAVRFGGPVALGGIISLTGFYGTRVFWSILEKNLLNPKPAIIQEEAKPKYGRLDRWKRWWSGYKTPAMIFDQSVKDRLEEIEKVTKNIREHIKNGKKDVKYRNLLLYGKPGTGKTLFAQILADKTDMDFLPVTAGSLLQSGVEGVKYFDELLDMANRSKYGVILFVDEADGLFIAREELLKAKALDHLLVLNHILAATGTGSNKFMLVAATNHSFMLDPAMGRRFQDRVEMPLPGEATRIELLNLYIKNVLSPAAQNLFTPAKIQEIARKTAGLSHAGIKDMIGAMSANADATESGLLTPAIIERTVEEAIKVMNTLERERLELERKTQGLPQPVMHKETADESAA